MKFYLIPDAAPGKRWHRTQESVRDEAKGRPFQTREMETSHAALVLLLNTAEAEVTKAAPEPWGTRPPIVPAAPPQEPKRGPAADCPRCKLTPRAADRVLQREDAIRVAERVGQMDGAELARVTEAVIERLKDLQGTVTEQER